MGLRIDQTWAKVGVRSQFAQLKLKINAPQLNTSTTMPRLSIDQAMSRIECDASRCRAESGLKSNREFTQENAQKGYENCLRYTGEKAHEGDMMARFDRYSNSAIMAYLGKKGYKEHTFNVAAMPRSPVEIRVIPGHLRTDWLMGDIKGSLRYGDVANHSTKPELQIYERQEGSITIDYQADGLNTTG